MFVLYLLRTVYTKHHQVQIVRWINIGQCKSTFGLTFYQLQANLVWLYFPHELPSLDAKPCALHRIQTVDDDDDDDDGDDDDADNNDNKKDNEHFGDDEETGSNQSINQSMFIRRQQPIGFSKGQRLLNRATVL